MGIVACGNGENTDQPAFGLFLNQQTKNKSMLLTNFFSLQLNTMKYYFHGSFGTAYFESILLCSYFVAMVMSVGSVNLFTLPRPPM